MANQFDLTSGQLDSSDRHDVHEVLYLLSGTLPGRGAVPDQTFYWATREVTVPLGAAGADVTFEPYLAPPLRVLRSIGFEPGRQSSTPGIPVPVRNLPFAHSESLVAAFSDDDFALESAEVTLRVAYIRPGQTEADLVSGDFRPLALDGFLGPPEDVRLDGMTLTVHNRGAKRTMVLKWPRLPEEVPYETLTPIDEASLGKYVPIMFGRPDGWFQPIVHSMPPRGFTTSGYSAGDTQVQVRLITRGGPVESQKIVSGKWWVIGNRWPAYQLSGGSTLDQENHVVTLNLMSGLAKDLSRGAYAEETSTDGQWVIAPHNNWGAGATGDPNEPPAPTFGWRLRDGTIKEDTSLPLVEGIGGVARRPRSDAKVIGHGELTGDASDKWMLIDLDQVGGTPSNSRIPNVYFDPSESLAVTTQPEFDQVQSRTMNNYPTGGTGTDNDKARDGNTDTAASLGVSDEITLTFPSAPSPFLDGDTVRTTLRVVTQGNIDFKNVAGSVTFGQATGAGGVNREFRFTQGTAQQFDETIRCIGAGGSGGSVVEVWWEHELETTAATTRTTDTVVGTGITVGETLEYADLVMTFPPGIGGFTPRGMGIAGAEVSGSRSAPTFDETTTVTSAQQRHPVQRKASADGWFTDFIRPTQAMAGLHALLGKEGHFDFINLASYDAAHQRFVDKDIRLNLVLNRVESWHELERMMGEQTRSVWFYGPSGHECIFMEDPAELEASGFTVRQSFRLPGVPGANCFASGGPLMVRTPVGELVNVAGATYKTDYLTGKTTTVMEKTNSGSVARVGEMRSAKAEFDFRWHNAVPHAGSGAAVPWTVSAQVADILQLYADRQAYARTRFTFDTAWVAHGVDRGSLIRVTYPVSHSPDSYRNVPCEVETIAASPVNAERFTITARSLYKPTKGLEPALIWTDVFDEEADQWTSEVLQEFDIWVDYWSLPDE